ncbi:predicted protein [Naegleria gruberi]|uniref:Predicted protein n=1 Tax=Naegleria gruberi TaxID=5762 RepID=D2W6H3_NAEGR|nr:uncharacterized protein NAEGRDRAFT_77017 [Naegleria gruberi]EFC35329.1 predicted protein [Naegleria gruberi]|eukprot:XP_002668073.1 predicted protein [Naegleria gruberi strain NEG-M]
MLTIPLHLDESSSYDQISSCSSVPESTNQTSHDPQQYKNQKLPQLPPHLQLSNNTSRSPTITVTTNNTNQSISANDNSSSLSDTTSTTVSSATTSTCINNQPLKMPQSSPSPNLQVSPLSSPSNSVAADHGYLGYSGKAYILVEKKSVNTNEGMHMVKCSLRLKEGKSLLIKKQSEHTLTFKITPFTCAKYTPISSGSNQSVNSRVLVTVAELSSSSLGDKSNNTVVGNNSTISSQPTSAKQAKQSYFVPELQFIFGSLE